MEWEEGRPEVALRVLVAAVAEEEANLGASLPPSVLDHY